MYCKLIYSMKHFSLITLLLCCSLIVVCQSPWTKEKGEGFAQLSLMAIPAYSDYFKDQNKTRTSSREYSEVGVQLYGEYGILDGTTLLGSLPLKILRAGDLVDSVSVSQRGNLVAPGNLKFAVKQRIYNDGIAVAGQLGVEVPFVSQDILTGLRTAFDSWTITPMISVGSGFGKGYVFGYGGLGFRTNNYSHYFTGGVEGGYKVFKPLWAMLFLDINRSFKNSTRVEFPAFTDSGFYVNDQEWVSLGMKLLFEINQNIGLTTSTTLMAVAANQVPQSPSVSIGFYSKLNQDPDESSLQE